MSELEQRQNPYAVLDYDGNKQHGVRLSYGDFLEDLVPIVEQFRVDFPDQFSGLACASADCMKDFEEDVFVNNFLPSVPDFWVEMDSEVKIVLNAMMRLRIESDEWPKFGEGRVRELVEGENLPTVLADKYISFYREAIDQRLSFGSEYESLDTFEEMIRSLSGVIRSLDGGYVRPGIKDRKSFGEVFGVMPHRLDEISRRNGWDITVLGMVKAAERLAGVCNVRDKYDELDSATSYMAEVISTLRPEDIPLSNEAKRFQDLFGIPLSTLLARASKHWELTYTDLIRIAKEKADKENFKQASSL